MKGIWNGFCTAFSLYSILPVPRVAWKKSNMRYALCFFPLVGVVIGALQLGWYMIAAELGLATGLFAAVAVLLPILVSGGIHVDGWVDTLDAVSSRADMEKKHEILKDPHTGAFGVMGCGMYLLLQWGLWHQVLSTPRYAFIPAAGYLLSRSFNALSIATFPTAKQSGLVYTFQDGASPRPAIITCGALAVAALLPCMMLSPLWGGIMAGGSVLYFVLHRRFCIREFGGNSGDLAGFLLQNLELGYLAIAVLGGVLT